MSKYDRAHRRGRQGASAREADIHPAGRGRDLIDWGGRDLVNWRRLGRRVWLLALAWTGLGLLGAGSATALLGSPEGLGALWAGVAALGFLVSVVGAVALSAFAGMLRAGERRERLAGGDVGLLPPQVRTRLHPNQLDGDQSESS